MPRGIEANRRRITRRAESSVISTLADVLPLPDHMLLTHVFRFGVPGIVVIGVYVAITTALISGVSATQVTANGAAFICANVCSYLLSALWNFSAKPTRANFLRFYAIPLLGLALTLAISWCAQTLGLSYWIELTGILSTVSPLTFVLHRFWTFR